MAGPLDGFQFRIENFKSLAEPSDWLEFGQVTLIVGRNNSGKSAILDALSACLDRQVNFNPEWHRHGAQAYFHVRRGLSEDDLRAVLSINSSGGPIRGNHWEYAKENILPQTVAMKIDERRDLTWVDPPNFPNLLDSSESRLVQQVKDNFAFPKVKVMGIKAERNVNPEPILKPHPVKEDGSGLTNLVRAFLYDSSLPMEEVEVGLLSALNSVFRGEMQFQRIICRQDNGGPWEIFLESRLGKPIRLSQSGNSLKSVFIILAVILLNKKVEQTHNIENIAFFIEEPENNLHPSLLRRLLEFLYDFSAANSISLLITTHSPTAIDWASVKADAKLIHVQRAGNHSTATQVNEYGGSRRLLEDLDVRASELLQANGVIWVEGPSDRTYLKKWISLATDDTLVEGIHYSIMFYGGRLLSHLSCAAPDPEASFIDLLRLSRNAAVLIDSDRQIRPNGKFRSLLNQTKRRIRDEAQLSGSYVWITDGREIENYISPATIQRYAPNSSTPGKYDSVVEILKENDKVRLADSLSVLLTKDDIGHLDLDVRLSELISFIRKWNGDYGK